MARRMTREMMNESEARDAAVEAAWQQTVPWWYWHDNGRELERKGAPRHACGHFVGISDSIWRRVPDETLEAITEEPCSFCLESGADSPNGLKMETHADGEHTWLRVSLSGKSRFSLAITGRGNAWVAIWVFPDGERYEDGPYRCTEPLDYYEDMLWGEIAAIKIDEIKIAEVC